METLPSPLTTPSASVSMNVTQASSAVSEWLLSARRMARCHGSNLSPRPAVRERKGGEGEGVELLGVEKCRSAGLLGPAQHPTPRGGWGEPMAAKLISASVSHRRRPAAS